jgi:two-component system phosphate regulon sensor histidine kinase PhoR
MKRRKLIPGPVLMVISILGITAFLLYWLKQSYIREEKSLKIKTEMAFRETIMQLQVAKLKLDGMAWDVKDSSKGKRKIILHKESGEDVSIQIKPKQEIISTISVIRSKLQDSMKKTPGGKPGMITISLKESSTGPGKDSIKFDRHIQGLHGGNGDRIFNLLYGVDSLQDSLRLSEIDSAYVMALKAEKISIPFSILQLDSTHIAVVPVFNEVTVGLAHPVTYQLSLGNTVPYLIKRLSLPILFSIILLSITILSFLLLYRNLMKQRRLGELKNEFISNITHELKTPIATVGVAIEALKNFNAMDNPQRTKEYLDISSNELQRLSLLVDKVLKLSMFEKKRN